MEEISNKSTGKFLFGKIYKNIRTNLRQHEIFYVNNYTYGEDEEILQTQCKLYIIRMLKADAGEG